MDIATRNRTIKKILKQAFPGHEVTVRGSRGTGYGWVTVKIDYTPIDRATRDELKAKIWQLFDAAKLEFGTYGYDGLGSDYGHGRTIHLEMNTDLESAALWERRGC